MKTIGSHSFFECVISHGMTLTKYFEIAIDMKTVIINWTGFYSNEIFCVGLGRELNLVLNNKYDQYHISMLKLQLKSDLFITFRVIYEIMLFFFVV